MKARPNLLIVDDDPDMLSILSRWCDQEGFAVSCAADGFEALFKLKEKRYDLVVTDLAMPGMHGLKLLDMLKTYDATIQVVVLTGHGSLETAVEALREGKAFDFLKKPLDDMATLTRSLSRAMDRRRELIGKPPPEPAPVQPLHDPDPMPEPGDTPPEPRGTEDAGFLSPRERDISRLLMEGVDPDEIARRLNLGYGTIKNHLSIIYEKLHVKGRSAAMMALRRFNLE